MKRLTLIRHGKSDWHSETERDFERPLNRRGEKAAPLMGQRLTARGCCPDKIISSSAKRALQTAKRIAKEIDYPESQIEYCAEIYEAYLKTLIDLLHNLSEQDTVVILIGHNPGFSELGQWLSPETPECLPTCGLLELELDIDTWAEAHEACATLLHYDYPKNLT